MRVCVCVCVCMCVCVCVCVETSIGRGKRSNPEWFTESSETLNPLIEAKNKAHLKIFANWNEVLSAAILKMSANGEEGS